jgi:DNA-binding protein H-NS
MKPQLKDLSETELVDLLGNAQKALLAKQALRRKEVIAQIKDLAAAIGVDVAINEGNSTPGSGRKGGKIAVKYRNPDNPAEQWTGRGMKPKWLNALLEEGRSLEDFAV